MFSTLGQLNFLPDLGLAALPFWIVTFGIGEETGWRGYALPRLQRRRSALSATIILWFLWTLWHLPLFFYTYDSAVLPGFLPGLFAGAIIFTWLYNSTGSILIAAVWHGLFNYTTACTACGAGIGAATISTMVMIGAVILIIVWKPLTVAPIRGK
jgi:membrane protease YdiL (CAAX protease family)